MYLGQIVEIGPRDAVISSPATPIRVALESVPIADPQMRRERKLSTDEIPSPVKPLGFVPVIKPMHEVSPGHFVQEH